MVDLGGREDKCEFGHPKHELLNLILYPPRSVLPRKFTIFNWFLYDTPQPGYCEGKDEVSKGIQHALSWERQASTHVMDLLLSEEPGVVLDIGAHIGWYSMLAEAAGRPCWSFDASVEHTELIQANAPNAFVYRVWIDESTEPLKIFDHHVRLMKVDVEGNELAALLMFDHLFWGDKVDAVLLEVTPPDFRATKYLVTHGFIPYLADVEELQVAEEYLPGQANYLFIR